MKISLGKYKLIFKKRLKAYGDDLTKEYLKIGYDLGELKDGLRYAKTSLKLNKMAKADMEDIANLSVEISVVRKLIKKMEGANA